ncbi:MAG: indolepyruvate oxidoreductase subunit beta, partial [Desulfobacteraceae bacterium]|nr:indolepyruvate oxidoreductase subunit beta [Desulfobacteraceae bacterium]
IVAVGGQGNLLASRVLGVAALRSEVPVRMSEIHGMAQRGGVVESALVFGGAQSTIISDGEADILLGFEPSETLRALKKCNQNTVIITNTSPMPPFTAAIGSGTYPDSEKIKSLLTSRCRRLITLDAAALAREAGNVLAVNMVLVGALTAADLLPLSPQSFESAMRETIRPQFLDINLKAFELGRQAAFK